MKHDKKKRKKGAKPVKTVKSYAVDRIVGYIAVLEDPDGENLPVEIPVSALPEEIEEGDVVSFDPENGSWAEDQREKDKRLARNQALLEKLLKKSEEAD